MQRSVGIVLFLTLSIPLSSFAEADLTLVWHAPASVVKLATTLSALERLGPDHRYETRFALSGGLDPESGRLDGDLLVLGGGDPDFHVENAFLVARELNALGLRTVGGRLQVDDRFWIGWEGGSEKRRPGESRRRQMVSRLQAAIDPASWDGSTRRLIEQFRKRSGIEGPAPSVKTEGGATYRDAAATPASLVVHRSNPLRRILKRFNAYSNNDIERLESEIGRPSELAADLHARWQTSTHSVRLDSLSGLGVNRMTAQQVVRLLRDLQAAGREHDLKLEDLLPAVGCDPGTLEKFPRLAALPAGSLVAKTGTLAKTDGGVAVLAGLARTREGDRIFCIAAPGAGTRLKRARALQEAWVLELFERGGGAVAHPCGSPVVHSDHEASLSVVQAPS
jgi:D-alanyl-D-alanine carboxypeptidase/D-alanyl-D-alanine-endopeptidase (penicillin-binding protein 4)